MATSGESVPATEKRPRLRRQRRLRPRRRRRQRRRPRRCRRRSRCVGCRCWRSATSSGGNRAKQFKTAFNAVTQKFLENLDVEDESGEEMKHRRPAHEGPERGGSEGDAVMVCAASKQNAENAKKLETALSSARRRRRRPVGHNKRSRFESELKATPPPPTARRRRRRREFVWQRLTRAGRGMAEGNPHVQGPARAWVARAWTAWTTCARRRRCREGGKSRVLFLIT